MIGDPYATLTDLKDRLRAAGPITNTNDDAALTNAVKVASAGIELFCDRQFNKETVATARKYRVEFNNLAEIDDFHTITSLVVETAPATAGTFSEVWSPSDYELRPLNGMLSGQPGWPFYEFEAVASKRFPRTAWASLQVTAQWGWAAVPATIKEVCLMVAAEVFKLKDAPLGVAGVNDFGLMRVRENPMAVAKLEPYRLDAVMVG